MNIFRLIFQALQALGVDLRDFGYLMQGIWKVSKAVSGMAFTLGGLLWAFVEFNGGLDGILVSINAATTMIQAAPVVPIMAHVNRVFPLNEFIIMESLLLTLWLGCMILRIVKSMIPGIN